MKQKCIFTLLAILVFTNIMVYSQEKGPIREYLHVPGPVMFNNNAYKLSWTSHPAANYYKQEYIVKGDNSEKFKSMVLLEVVTDNANIKDIVDAKVAELNSMKATNPLVNYELITNPATGEYMLDFLVSQDNPGTRLPEIVERNVYRYKPYISKGKQTGVILLGISTRSYGNDINPFLVSLKSNRKDLVNKLSQYKIPEIVITP